MQALCIVAVLLLALYGLSRLLMVLCVRLTAGKKRGIWVLPLKGEHLDLELYLRFANTINLCGTGPEIWLVDVGLDTESLRLAHQLCEKDGRMRVLSLKEAENLFQTGLHSCG